MKSPDELRELVDAELERLPLTEELGELEGALRYSLLGGGKRIRPVLCLATGEALGCDPNETLPSAAASRARTSASARGSPSSPETRFSPRPSASCSGIRAPSPRASSPRRRSG